MTSRKIQYWVIPPEKTVNSQRVWKMSFTFIQYRSERQGSAGEHPEHQSDAVTGSPDLAARVAAYELHRITMAMFRPL
jgi:hypothetical protein